MAMGRPGSEAQGPLCAQRCLQPMIDVREIVGHIRLAHHPLRLGAVEADAPTSWRARALECSMMKVKDKRSGNGSECGRRAPSGERAWE